jgi:hypothetical protein
LKFSSNENKISSTFKLLIVHQKYYYSAAVDAEMPPPPSKKKTNTKNKKDFSFHILTKIFVENCTDYLFFPCFHSNIFVYRIWQKK